MRKILFIWLIIITEIGWSQERTDLLLDSLLISNSSTEKISLSHQIAEELKLIDGERAIYYIEYASQVAENSGSASQIAKNAKRTADFYYSLDILDASLNWYLKAYAFYSKQAASLDLLETENSLAIIYARLKDEEKAMEYFRNIHRNAIIMEDTLSIVKSLNNIATTYLRKNEIDSSLYYYQSGLNLIKDTRFLDLKAFIYTNLGRNHHLKKQKDSSFYYFKAAQNLEENPKLSDNTKGWINFALADMYFKENQMDSTIYYTNKSMPYYKNTFSFDNLDATKLLYQSYIKSENYKEASDYFQLYDSIRDSLNITEKLTNVERVKLEQFYREKEALKTFRENQQKSKLYIIGLSIALAFLILLIIFARNKNKLTKSRLKNELMLAKEKELNANIELKNQALAAKAMLEIQTNKIISEVSYELKQVQRKIQNKENKRVLEQINFKLNNKNNKKIWEEFMMSFEKVHTSFFDNLIAKHPGLSLREKRLCALLKLNLTTKEIAQLTGQSEKSIENSRTRLRKKLEMTHIKMDITTYLERF